MIEILKNLGFTLGYTAIIALFAFYIIRFFIELIFSKDLEKFKGNLEKEAIAYKTTFQNLHTERASVIKETYKRIVETQRTFESLMNPVQLEGEPDEKTKRQAAADAFSELSSFFHQNEIYFDPELADEIDAFITRLQKTWNKFHLPRFDDTGKPYRDVEEWSELWEYMRTEIPNLKSDIEGKFRLILGIE